MLKSKETKAEVGSPRWQCRETLNPPCPTDTPTHRPVPSEEELRAEQTPTAQGPYREQQGGWRPIAERAPPQHSPAVGSAITEGQDIELTVLGQGEKTQFKEQLDCW